MPEKYRIIRNKAQCSKCGDIIESTFRHDFVNCKCGAIYVDGGHDYLRRLGNLEDIIELSEVENENVVSEPKEDVSETPVRRASRNAHVLRRLEKRKKSRRLHKE